MKRFAFFLLAIWFSFPLFAGVGSGEPYCIQRDTLSVRLQFPHNFIFLDTHIGENEIMLDSLVNKWNSVKEDSSVRKIHICVRGNAALDETVDIPNEISSGRAALTADYLTGRGIDSSHIYLEYGYYAFYETEKLIDAAADTATSVNPSAIYDVLMMHPEGGDIKGRLLAFDPTGAAWSWLSENVLEPSSFSEVTLWWEKEITPLVVDPPAEVAVVAPAVVENVQEEVKQKERKVEPKDSIMKSEVRLGTNLLYDIGTVANLSLEIGFARRCALNVLVTFSPWDVPGLDLKLRTLLIQPEFRVYFADNFRGHYLGVEGHLGWYNVALPGSRIRYQDRDGNTPAWGGGLTYGYVVRFSRHWGMDFSVGVGYTHLDYDCFYNTENGTKFTSSTKDWIGPTKAGISLYCQF